MSLPWPIRGTIDFATTPRWWGWPLFAVFVVGLISVGCGAGVFCWLKPTEDAGWWAWLWAWLKAVSLGFGSMALVWVCLQSAVLGMAFESIIRRVQRQTGAVDVAGQSPDS